VARPSISFKVRGKQDHPMIKHWFKNVHDLCK